MCESLMLLFLNVLGLLGCPITETHSSVLSFTYLIVAWWDLLSALIRVSSVYLQIYCAHFVTGRNWRGPPLLSLDFHLLGSSSLWLGIRTSSSTSFKRSSVSGWATSIKSASHRRCFDSWGIPRGILCSPVLIEDLILLHIAFVRLRSVNHPLWMFVF